MKAVMFDVNLPTIVRKKLHLAGPFALLKYKEDWPQPTIQYPNQIIAKNRMGGICTSDLHEIDLKVSYYETIMASKNNPFPNGHELVAEVYQIGNAVKGFNIGDRVVYTPIPDCKDYGFKPCVSCANGNHESCQCLIGVGDGSDTEKLYGGRGKFGGFEGGGFSEFIRGFVTQFFKVPINVPDEVAVLTEPFAVALHAVCRNRPKDTDKVIVIGAGIIGLLTIAAIRCIGLKCKVISIAKYPFQSEAAKRLGADEVVWAPDSITLFEKIQKITGGTLVKPLLSTEVNFGNQGPDIIFDCIASESSVDQAMRIIRNNGTIVLVGVAINITKKVDWAISIYKELHIVGTMMHGIEEYREQKIDAFALALHFMAENPQKFEKLVTHTFTIEQYKQAFSFSHSKKKANAIKVVFKFT